MRSMSALRPDPAASAPDGFVFEISGGHLALDLANTASRRPDTEPPRERLTDFGRLVTWGEQAGLVKGAEGERLRAGARAHPRAAAATLRRAVRVREAIYALFSSHARGDRPPSDALAVLNE